MTILKPGDDALLFLTVPTRDVCAVRVTRVWRSCGGTERIEVRGADESVRIRRGASFDRRQLIACAALETLSP